MTKLPPMKPWKVNRSVTVIKDRWIDLRAEDCTTANGIDIAPYYVLNYPDWTHVVCLDQQDRVCVVSQYRHPVARTVLELPGGWIEQGEDPLDAAKRELQEETGITASEWRSCGSYPANPATHTNNVYLFACRVESIADQDLDAQEDIGCAFLTMPELRSSIDRGEFSHLSHIGALCLALNLI